LSFGDFVALGPPVEGGSASVYRGRRADGVAAAIKVASLREVVERELSLLARLARRRGPAILDAGVAADGRVYIATTWVEGTPLAGPLSEADVWRVAWDVAQDLAELHEARIFHGDVKPANVLRTGEGPAARSVVIDLGLADAVGKVVDATDADPPRPWHPYAQDAPYVDKIAAVAKHVYGADGIEVAPAAVKELTRITAAVGTDLPVCIAKTHLSLSDDPSRRGVPHGFTITVREARLAAGAGFVVASTGSIVTMPGLPREPAALRVHIRPDGSITGLMAGDTD
jgi:serine/threonine protein kinase